jgi:filamentous hemagglutinin
MGTKRMRPPTAIRAALALAVPAMLADVPALAQSNFAYWQAGNGDWGTAANWQCYNPNFSSCVPASGYEVYISSVFGSGETVTLNQNATVLDVFGTNPSPGGSMIIPGTSLTTTDASGPPSATFNALTVNSGGSVTAAGGIAAVTLNATDATLNANVSVSTLATLTSTTINGSLMTGALTMTDTTVGNGGGVIGKFTISGSTVTGPFGLNAQQGISNLVNSSFGTVSTTTVGPGASLNISSSTLTSVATAPFTVNGGVASLAGGATYTGMQTLNVQNGGSLSLSGTGTKLSLSGSLDGAVLIDSNNPVSPSIVNVQSGAQLLTDGAELIIGYGKLNVTAGAMMTAGNVTSAGNILVAGTGSQFAPGNLTLIGTTGSTGTTSTLTVQNGALVKAVDLTLGATGGGGAGALTLSGASTLEYVTLTATHGPSTGSGIYLSSGSHLDGSALSPDSLNVNATITGANSIWSTGQLTVANANLTLSSGGQLSSDGSVTVSAGATTTVTGSGSMIRMTGLQALAVSGGQLVVQNQGAVNTYMLDVASGSASVSSGGTVSTGLVSVGGGGSAGAITVSDSGAVEGVERVSISNRGTLTLTAGDSMGVSSQVLLGAGGTLDVRSGAMTIGTITPPPQQGWVYVGFGGKLLGGELEGDTFAGPGTLKGSLATFFGGTVAPGDPETLDITGGYSQTGGTLDLRIDGTKAGQFDTLALGGSAQITGGKIVFDFADGFAPKIGQTFDLITAADGVTFSNTGILVDGLAPGWDYSLSDANGKLLLTALSNGISTGNGGGGGGGGGGGSSVPEPSPLMLLATGLLGLGCASRRRDSRARRAHAGGSAARSCACSSVTMIPATRYSSPNQARLWVSRMFSIR